MKEKELRIALVCFGGTSLAVYMYGISREILKLVRASSVLHSIPDRFERSETKFFDRFPRDDPEYDTDDIYFQLLQDIGQTLELRVIVDIIAGASAGGINGTMLARAISHDLPMRALRDLWLNHADVNDLLADEARAHAASKFILRPMIGLMNAVGVWEAVKDPEVRRNLSLFVRSRWFKPPLSGSRMSELMYNAVTAMVDRHDGARSLLPAGHALDLYVAVTDYHGFEQSIPIHSPPVIHDREHRHILHFGYSRQANGEVRSDFLAEDAPALAFAARATSSFPGAFPPAQIREMDEFVARNDIDWPGRSQFLARNFAPYSRVNVDPTAIYFIDGSVLNNRPFEQAIAAIRDRPAYRPVDRRLVYIDPDPTWTAAPARRALPGFFSTLRSALSDLPRVDPIADELGSIADFNDRIRRMREIVENARPNISASVNRIIGALPDRPIGSDVIRSWREQINTQLVSDAGFAYQGYIRLKLSSVRVFIASLIAGIRGAPAQSQFGRTIAEIVDVWAIEAGAVYSANGATADHWETAGTPIGLPRWAKFLLDFDVDYRKRRLHFLIEGINRLYQLADRAPFAEHHWRAIDQLKGRFYDCIQDLNRRTDVGAFAESTRDLVEDLFRSAPAAGDAEKLRAYAVTFAQQHREAIGVLVNQLAREIDLESRSSDIDDLLAACDPAAWHPDARRDILIDYLGFPFWDVLMFPMMPWREVGELHEILVDRISPLDATTLPEFSGAASLKGIGFRHFAAFLSRGYRENDYLLGRLHALDRLIDIVCNSARIDPEYQRTSILALKLRGFRKILDAEEKNLTLSAELIAKLRLAIDAVEAANLARKT
ncbi:MAG: patatin-like protein [Bradyrhizobium sp.]|uniref:patatin-like protein n=1 Tax=Bradyrhizobium sp. TaxID=376 RepID=UPI0025C15A52|nr:patatin-like protein [Bradyrhizobium sp.]MBI5260218.1 patatin-like protein [Bradyrhizobium sp.]